MKHIIEMSGMECIRCKVIKIYAAIFWLPATACGQAIFSQAEMIPSDMPTIRNEVYAENLEKSSCTVRIFNTTIDPVYLFSSYLYDDYFMSPYLHMYSKKEEVCTLSLLPLPYFLSFTRSDNLILEKSAVVNQHQLLYQFTKIPPAAYLDIFLPETCFDADYVKRYMAKDLSLHIRPKFVKYNRRIKCPDKEILFAIYSNTEALNKECYYTNPSMFAKEIVNYNILSVMVD